METRVVETALVKIASLSKVALGDAGMDILSVNLKGGSEFNRKDIIVLLYYCLIVLLYYCIIVLFKYKISKFEFVGVCHFLVIEYRDFFNCIDR